MNTTLTPASSRACIHAVQRWAWVLCAWIGLNAHAQTVLTPELAVQVRQLISDKLSGPLGSRSEIQLGKLDPRLKLAPCQLVEAYVPSGSRLWGASRIGLRCTQGASPWNVYLPVAVFLYGSGVVASSDLPAGHVLKSSDLRMAEVNLTESRSPIWPELSALIGRSLATPVNAGQSLRHDTIKPRVWFTPGDTVQVRATGGGFSVVGTGEALSAGLEGQTAKVRTDSGKVVRGIPVAERQLEVHL